MQHPPAPIHMQILLPLGEAWPKPQAGSRPSAVALLMAFDPVDHWHIVLTKRSTHVGSHKGQIGLAGGRADPDDHSPEETALREVEEELGLARTHVQCLGRLPAIRALDGSPVVPIVATTLVPASQLQPSPTEVAQIIPVPWRELQRTERQAFRFNIFGVWRESSLYQTKDVRIWGLTAKILDMVQFG